MKKMFLFFVLMIAFISFAFPQIVIDTLKALPPGQPAVEIKTDVVVLAKQTLTWFGRNWAWMALVVSELAAFLPIKYTGIVKSVSSFITKIVNANKKK